ncbi:D-threo-aldose 1-dehydrogenase [Actinoplanes octamycinicus]|uniref:D-threo-aldose 1-dehydrogenase n=1 Tax=Actinoplanes octamycinicus TaxID=135948 RepID=A0A7W7MA74_9ACTN|nr:aldo/keto reductase [Actinoplanes octamycinicus]MBB4742682.1 D-threo-aldose 1-dehydrogenase [Actinoplanes octamycinicus]GIE62985.1 oxidoreductase [Actinoplanes octamycinicus]
MDPFARVSLGGTGVTVTRLGMGLAPIAGLFTPVGAAGARTAVDAAWEQGVRFFDTAPFYGAGLSERRGGAALRDRDRSAFTLATKVGRRLTTGGPAGDDVWAEPSGAGWAWDFSTDGVREQHAASLERLGLDRVDILHLHDPDDHFGPALHDALPALVQLREEGAVGAVSAGMNQSAMLTEFARTGQFDCFLLAGRYTLLDQSGLADLLPECARRGISVICGGVYNSGILADPADGATFDYRPATPATLARARAMAAVCARHGVPLRAAALQFPLAHPAVASVLIGMRSAAEAADAAAMAAVQIPGALWHDLIRSGLLDPDVPHP